MNRNASRRPVRGRGRPASKQEFFIGLISGTSIDGIKAALLGLPAIVPGITGAKRPVVLGKIVPVR